LSILLSEEAFDSQCGELYNSNLFGEDLSQVVSKIAQADGHFDQRSKVAQILQQANEANVNNSAFFTSNKDWIISEVENYLQMNKAEMEQRKEEEKYKNENDVKEYLDWVDPKPQ